MLRRGPRGAVGELPLGVKQGPLAEPTSVPWYECPGQWQIVGKMECQCVRGTGAGSVWPGTHGGLGVTQEVGEVGRRPRGARRAKRGVRPGSMDETGGGWRQLGSQCRVVTKVPARDRAGLARTRMWQRPRTVATPKTGASQRQSHQPCGQVGCRDEGKTEVKDDALVLGLSAQAGEGEAEGGEGAWGSSPKPTLHDLHALCAHDTSSRQTRGARKQGGGCQGAWKGLGSGTGAVTADGCGVDF